ncbi:protocadherin beta-3-like isoform X41 [Denticeps clupeoides]|uniref:protocadherin beta-3-like isoform X41 n=1 Tax=Denticeps clupeoides TaxID=299321 RepID=UPI0010A53E5D|nr:protocadherin beta-3-like isoform X41 [Denticeps clupeoides]
MMGCCRCWTWAMVAHCLVIASLGQIRYSIPEEMRKGSVVGNIAHDLGLDPTHMKASGARIVSDDSGDLIELNINKGTLVVKERIDRERLCGQTSPCSLSFELILLNPMQLHSIVVEILDVNDNPPVFKEAEIALEILESALPGTRLLQGSATDADVGNNALRGYALHPTDSFSIKTKTGTNGGKYVELYLNVPLDREKAQTLSLTLTAFDGGDPSKSSSMKINIIVLDTNDNVPAFTQHVYRGEVAENAGRGAVVASVSASDADEGPYGQVSYHFSRDSGEGAEAFAIDEESGDITVQVDLDYEKVKHYELTVEAKDQGGHMDSTKVIIDVTDVNDNVPVIALTSFSSPIAEDSPSGTTVAIINVRDLDSGSNGKVECSVKDKIPFAIRSSLKNYYTLITDGKLDRETTSEYNITFTAVDSGEPRLSTEKTISLKVSDVNDNAPVFEQSSYSATISENNSPGAPFFCVRASDADWNQNARVSYLLVDSEFNGNQVSSYISVNAESGALHAVRAFDYEQMKSFEVQITAQDGGSPPLASNTTVKIYILDQNDNGPQILYPIQSGGSLVAEMVPRAADVGYLVTKVVAVDVDSGQNAWLSYKLQKATDRALFEVGAQNGEIRTARQVTDKDPVKQKLTVVVEDNGQPSRSATVNVNVAVADSFPEVLSEFTDFTHEKEKNENLTFYLVLALAAVSFLFICCLVVIISVKIYRWRQSRLFCQSNLPVIPYYPPHYADTGRTGTLQQMYNYEVCSTTDSRKSDSKFVRPGSHSVLLMDPNYATAETLHHTLNKHNLLDDANSSEMQKPPSNDWRLPPNQRPGPSGAVAHPEGAPAVTGTGPWPNPPTEAEQLQALMAAANEVSEATATLGPRYNAQYVPDYRQNVYIPGSTATLTTNPQQPPQQALPPPQALPPADAPKAAQTPASKKKSAKKDKK